MPSARQRRSIALTLLCTLLVAFALVQTTDAHGLDPAHKRHAGRDRILKSRQLSVLEPGTVGGEAAPPISGNDGVDNAGSEPKSAPTSSPTGTAASSPTSSSSTTSSSSSSSSSSTATGNALSSLLSSLLSSSSSTSSTATSSSSSSTTSSSSSTSSSSTSSSSSSTTSSIPPTSSSSQTAAVVTDQPPPSTTDVTQTVSASSTPSANTTTADATDAAKTSSTTVTKETITAIVAVAASIGAIFLIWTGIRKWKFSPSKNFNDRMQAIDWEPTSHEGADSGLPGHRRVASVASSFRSGDNAVGYGGSFHGHGASSLAPLPEHDFTAGPVGAPVGTYADLARGPSPQPSDMVQRGPSLNRSYGATNY